MASSPPPPAIAMLHLNARKVMSALEVESDAHAWPCAEARLLTGGTTDPVAAVPVFAIQALSRR